MTSYKGHSCRHLGTVPKCRQIGTFLCKMALKIVPDDQSFKNVPNDWSFNAPVSVESVLFAGCPYNGLRMNRNQGVPVYGPEPF